MEESADFPTQAYLFSFDESDHWKAQARLVLLARRLRAYATLVATCPIPIRYAFVGDRIFLPQLFDPGTPSLSPIPGVPAWLFRIEFARKFTRALPERLKWIDSVIERESGESPLDRSVVHIGEAVCASDWLDAFFHCWRAVEIVAGEDERRGRQESARAKGNAPPDATGAMPSQAVGNLDLLSGTSRPVARTVQSRLNLDITREVASLEDCRDAVAHGQEGPEHVRLVFLNLPRVFGIAYGVTSSALVEKYPESRKYLDIPATSSIPPLETLEEDDPAFAERIRESLHAQYDRGQRARQ